MGLDSGVVFMGELVQSVLSNRAISACLDVRGLKSSTNLRTHSAAVDHNHRATVASLGFWELLYNHTSRQVYHSHTRPSCDEQLTHHFTVRPADMCVFDK